VIIGKQNPGGIFFLIKSYFPSMVFCLRLF
jgi:hypothetical protein